MFVALVSAISGHAIAQEEHESGFFSYLPAAPDMRLPKIDIVPFWTSDLKIGKKAYKSENYDRAFTYFQKASEDGNPVADWYLGHMYRLGRGVPKDASIAYSYYSRVAEAFDPEEQDKDRLRIAVDCQLQLANYQRLGVPEAGIGADPERAARTYLRLASNYGHPGAMYALGVMTITGTGVKKNPQQGIKWLMAAARKRDPEAQAYLGDLYKSGEFVRRDETRALMWYVLASETVSDDDQSIIRERFKVLRDTASEDIRLEAEARARVWAEQYPAGKVNAD
jgi:TPR repeat protein